MKIFRPITLLLTLCLVLILSVTFVFATDASVTMNCVSTAKAGDTVTITGTAESGVGISIKIIDASGNIVFFDVVKTNSNGQYTIDFIVPESLAGTTLTIVAGYGSNVTNKTLAIGTTSSSTSSGGYPGGGGNNPSGGTTTEPGAEETSIDNPGKGTYISITKLSATTDDSGKASAGVDAVEIISSIKEVVTEATNEGKKASIKIEVSADSDAKAVETKIPLAAMNELANEKVKENIISNPIATITFDQSTMKGIAAVATEEVKITAAKVDVTTLPSSVKEQVGDHPVFDFSVSSGDNLISKFNGNVTVAIPYKLSVGEDASNVVIYYINDSGELEIVKNCRYDEESGTVVFKTTHFSRYAVKYNSINFSDVDGWCKDYVNYLASRDIIKGKGDGKFSPSANITRAEFAQILANMSSADLSTYTESNFSDVESTDWYCSAVTWAYENGIVLGTNGQYNPNANITRQDMALMLERYTEKIANTTLDQTVTAVNFADQNSISDYAKEAVSIIQQAGIISGRNDNTFDPKANATRAESSKMIALLLQSLVK